MGQLELADLGGHGRPGSSCLQLSSQAWLYPTSFPETFCITAAEAGFARCPIVTTACFGLETTVGYGGVLLRSDPDSPKFGQIFKAHAVRLLTDGAAWREASDRAYDRMRRFTWSAVADQWASFLETGAGNRSTDPWAITFFQDEPAKQCPRG